jgi:hypothetical protein
MKKSVILATAVAALAFSSVVSAQGYNRGYNQGYNNNGWNYAAAALGGVVVGGIIGAIANANQPVQPVYGQVYGGYMPPPVYAPPGPGYVPAPAYSPGWQQRCNNAQTLPVVNAYGQIINYTITCR